MENTGQNYLESTKKLFAHYKSLADKAIAQITDEQLHWQYNTETNSIAIIMQHMAGNSISRWTDFMTSDGEKNTRNRDAEFETTTLNKQDLLVLWEKGWQCLFNAIEPLTEKDMLHIIYIRNEGDTVTEAINRQLAHLPYHVGQIIFLAKMMSGANWQPLTIAKGQSQQFNSVKFSEERGKKFFTDNK